MNKSLDRDYFKRKANPRSKKGPQLTSCCGQDKDYDNLNVKSSEDWKLIENHIEEHLREYTKHISVTPVSCEKCGILLEYVTEIDIEKTLGYYEKSD
tara:strand:+ start:484 stop:774 length:291 start_codon:yes stop_codon:yes gene_type:complete